MRILDKGRTYLPGQLCSAAGFERIARATFIGHGVPLFCFTLRCVDVLCLDSTTSAHAARHGLPSAAGFVHCFHRRSYLRFHCGRVGSDPNLYHARAFARLCIVRCPLPMIISSLVIVSAGDLRAVRRVPVPGGRAAMFQHPSAFISSFIIISSFHHCSSLSVDVAMTPA